MSDGFTIGLWSNQQTDVEFLKTLVASKGLIQGPTALKMRLEQVVKNLERDGHGTRDGLGHTPDEHDAWRNRVCGGRGGE